MDGEGDVLMYAAVAPKDTRGVGVFALVRSNPVDDSHFPFTFFGFGNRHLVGRPAVVIGVLLPAPAADVVRTGDYTGFHSLGYPGAVDEISNVGVDPDQVAGFDVPAFAILDTDPERVAVRDFREPFSVAR